ncbi:Fructosamine/Ketosamine-3-kinase [Cyanobacterium aponinum PCC 10605]|uniref:Fructosamine/Ketosamine-3-kinase n=2 Tax=Cyanobacterium TaxID=102234 RepID=K9Z010_CYAAP|nr:Fructosamine/Ketosamine-3-kinase [Cyanobacterium aponinum PCC 10605]
MTSEMWSEIISKINQNIEQKFEMCDRRSIGGGCINQAYQLIGTQESYFIKLNSASSLDMFMAEALGLEEMYSTHTILVPKPICYGIAGNNSYIVLEYFELGRGSSQSWQLMGKKLAQLHRYQKETRFGWKINNTIGSTPQINDWGDNWSEFFAETRIGYQLKLANRKGANFSNIGEIVAQIKDILSHRNPHPSLLHGDLWSGNAAFTADGTPTIFDPAFYYGDREADIAMTELFGGFPSDFYQGYNQEYPLDSGYQQRKTIYNLYHILNHFNLFGGGYLSQAKSMINRIIK